MNLVGAVISMLFALLIVLALLVGCVLATVMAVRVFRHRARVEDDSSATAVVRRMLSSPPPRRMAAPQPAWSDDAEGTATWRYRQLLELGLDPVTAIEVATSAVDLASMRTLVDKGCPAPLASRILR